MKKLAIIIPVYNTEKYIGKCLDSIISQMDNDMQLIIVDDNSTDKSLEIIKGKIAGKKDIILLENNFNYGVSFSRNKGLAVSKSEYVFFVDSDDFINDGTLNIIKTYLNCNDDIIKFGYNRKIGFYNQKRSLERSNNYSLCDDKNLLYLEDGFIWNKVFKKAHIDDLMFDNVKYEDLPFSITALITANSIINIPKILYNYRMNPNSITFKDRYIPNLSILDIFKANDLTDGQLKQLNKFQQYQEILNDMHVDHSFGATINCAFWFKMKDEDRKELVNLLINYIKNKYNIDNIYDNKLIKTRIEKNKLYAARIKFIESTIDNKKATQDCDLNTIKQLIKKYNIN